MLFLVSILFFLYFFVFFFCCFFLFQAEDGIRDLVRSRGLGDVYKRQAWACAADVDTDTVLSEAQVDAYANNNGYLTSEVDGSTTCLLYTSDAADERSSVDLGGRRIIKNKKQKKKTKTQKTKNKTTTTTNV